MRIPCSFHRSLWERLLQEGIHAVEQLPFSESEKEALRRVTRVYPMRINRYFWEVVRAKGDCLARQVLPDMRELEDTVGLEDPLGEEKDSPVPHLTHRYPDRVLFLVTLECAVYCRFCTRKRKVGHVGAVTDETIRAGIDYIAAHPEIQDVLISGGDPLILPDARLGRILSELRSIPHVRILRIGTRIPGVLPQRITPRLVRLLRRFQPLYLNLHFNHPEEITPEVRAAVGRLANGGIPLGCQTVLLRGINDEAGILERLFRELLALRIRPYYLLQGDLARGTDHFRTPLAKGISILESLRGRVSGLALPWLMVDLPGGGGKVPVGPDYVIGRSEEGWTFRSFWGESIWYPEPSL